MKIITTTLVALLATASVAFATDLPSKKKAPAAAGAAAAAVEAVASSDSLKVEYGQDLANNFGAKVDDAYTVTYKHSIGGGFAIGPARVVAGLGALLDRPRLGVRARALLVGHI